jgi:hypothetical protein
MKLKIAIFLINTILTWKFIFLFKYWRILYFVCKFRPSKLSFLGGYKLLT